MRLLLAVAVLCYGCALDRQMTGKVETGIVDGTASTEDAVVFLIDLSTSASCSGALIADNVVLTAKHCVVAASDAVADPTDLRVREGRAIGDWDREHSVKSIHPLPGPVSAIGSGEDVALLILGSSSEVMPLPVSFADPTELSGQQVRVVGFGRTELTRGGEKLEVATEVTGVFAGDTGKPGALVRVAPSICTGDSGGPLIDGAGAVRAVASFLLSPDGSSPPECGTAPGAHNTLWQDQAFVDAVLATAAACVPELEQCNGVDDDCNDLVDEGCTPFGEACADSSECNGVCEDLGSGPVCTAACAPFRGSIECPSNFRCVRTEGCQGRCLSQEVPQGTLQLGQSCDSDRQCASDRCSASVDDARQCVAPCYPGALMCLADEACDTGGAVCGVCGPLASVAGPRADGESCAADADCASGRCHDDRGVRFCAKRCGNDSQCGSPFHCRDGTCIPGTRGGLGTRCVASGDCAGELVCAAEGPRPWCASLCQEMSCPAGHRCVAAGISAFCRPNLALDGDSCRTDTDCVSGFCADLLDTAVCASRCGPGVPCSPGLHCLNHEGHGPVCLEPAAGASGCRAAGQGAPGRPAAALMAILLGCLVLSRRRRYSRT